MLLHLPVYVCLFVMSQLQSTLHCSISLAVFSLCDPFSAAYRFMVTFDVHHWRKA